MERLTYKRQLILVVACVIAGLICADIFHHWLFASLGIVIAGFLFVVNPVYPQAVKYPWMKRIMRITGVAIIVLGLMTRYKYY